MPILAEHILSKRLFPLMKKYSKGRTPKNLAAAARENLKRCDRRSLRSDSKFSIILVKLISNNFFGGQSLYF